MSDKSIFASTAAKAGTDARPPPPSPAKTRAYLALLDVRYVLEILLIDPGLYRGADCREAGESCLPADRIGC